MDRNDRWTSIIWGCLGLYVAYEGCQLKLGGLHNPGCGFLIFGAGITLSILSLVLFIRTFASKNDEKKALWKGLQWPVGIKLMIALFAALIDRRRWDIVATLCRETLTMPDTSRGASSTVVTYLFASEHLELLEHRNQQRKLNRVSLHADILKERHETGRLTELSPWQQFQDADVFLYLRSVFEQGQEDLWNVWRPWTAVFLRGCPGFLLEAIQREKAEELLKPLGAKDLADLRRRLKEAAERLHKLFGSRNPFFYPFANLNPDLIGTK